MMIFLVVKIVGCLFSLLANNYITFGLGRALIGFGGAGLFLSNFVLGNYTFNVALCNG